MIPAIVYIVINIIDAYTDRKRAVNHKRGAWLYILVCIWAGWMLVYFADASILDVCLLPLLTRAAIFDPVLNLMRGKSILYEGIRKPKGEGSWVDELERKSGLSVFWLRVIYLTLYISYLIFFYGTTKTI